MGTFLAQQGEHGRVAVALERRRPLSDRQCATLQRLGRGMLPAGIARELGCDEETVKTHIRRAMEKLGASTRAEAVLVHARVHRSCHR